MVPEDAQKLQFQVLKRKENIYVYTNHMQHLPAHVTSPTANPDAALGLLVIRASSVELI